MVRIPLSVLFEVHYVHGRHRVEEFLEGALLFRLASGDPLHILGGPPFLPEKWCSVLAEGPTENHPASPAVMAAAGSALARSAWEALGTETQGQ